jgi:small GTP-binding protein
MPANLPPQYVEAEGKLRQAKTTADKILALEEMLAIMPKHKGTDHLRAELRRRIAKLTEASDKKLATQRTSLLIEREGAAQVVLIGIPNAGKSQLVSALTSASPAVADYPFTTQRPIPGMMPFENIQIQLIDTPPLVEQSIEWWLVNTIRRADVLLTVIDLSHDPLEQMETILAELGTMRVQITGVTREYEADAVYTEKKVLLVANKIDLPGAGRNFQDLRDIYGELPAVAVSARDGTGLETLKGDIFRLLNIIRVYTKAPGKKADLTEPIILERGSTLEQAAADIHKDFARKLKYARIWGSGKHDGVMAKKNHVLEDGDIIELHL